MNAPHWLSSSTRRPGFGAGPVDFAAYMQELPSFASSWNDIQTQLTHEGAGINQVVAAQTSFTNAYEQLSSQFGAVGDDAITGAHAFVTMGQTVAGAASTVSGLIQTAQSGSAPQITQAFTGVLVSLAISTGAVSAGIGAAIVAGVGLILSALGSLGLFGGGGGTNVCGATVSPPPDLVVGCMPIWTSSPQQQPGTFGWRSFPIPNVDGAWFTPTPPYEPYVGGGVGAIDWKGLSGEYYGVGVRGVDYAFPNYARIAADAGPMSSDFQKAFFSAWKGNAEYALNGLKTQPDALVLIHMLRLWNKSHAGPAVPIRQGEGSYLSTLVSTAIQSLTNRPEDAGVTDGTNLLLNNGPVLNPSAVAPSIHRVISLHIPRGAIQSSAPAPAPAPTTSTGLSAGEKVAVGGAAVTGAALLGAVAFGIVKGQAVDLVLKHAWKHVRGWF